MKLTISLKSKYGKYRAFTKEFKDSNHYDNWAAMMERKGHKIIGYDKI